jgi:hypothetical protein
MSTGEVVGIVAAGIVAVGLVGYALYEHKRGPNAPVRRIVRTVRARTRRR